MFYISSSQLKKICQYFINWSLWLIIFLTPLVFAIDQGNFNIFELNKLVVFRTLISVAMITLLIKTSLSGSWQQRRHYFILYLLLPLVAYVLLSLTWSLNPYQSFFGNYARQQGILSLLYYWLWFVILLIELPLLKARYILLALLSSSAVVCVYGCLQKFNLDWLSWSESGASRAFASLGQPNFLGYYLSLVIFLTLAGWSVFTKLWQRCLLILLLVLQVSVLIFTASRGAFLGLLAGLLVLICLKFYHRFSRSLLLKLGLFLLSLLLVSSLLFGQLSKDASNYPVLSRYLSSFSQVQGSSRIRLFYWQAAWQEFRETSWSHRLLGYGKDTQSDIFVRHYQPKWGLDEKLNTYPDRAHNLIIDLWLEFGLIGLLLFTVFNLWIISKAIIYYLRQPQAANSKLIPYLLASVSAYFVSNLFGFSLTTHYVYYYLILAWLWILSSESEAATIKLPVSQLFLTLVTVSLSVFSLFCLWQFSYRAFLADMALMQAKKGEANFNCVQAIDGIDSANAWQPLDPHYQSQLLFIYNNCLPLVDDSSRQVLIESLLKHLQLVGERPTSYDFTLNLARSYSLLGLYLDRSFYQAAADYYKSLLAINPNILSAYQDYGRMLIWSGDYAQAEVILRQGIAKSPIQLTGSQSGTHQFLATSYTYYLWQLVGDCAYNQGHFSEALKIYQEVEAKNLVSKDLYQSIADSYYQLGDYRQSTNYLNKVKGLSS